MKTPTNIPRRGGSFRQCLLCFAPLVVGPLASAQTNTAVGNQAGGAITTGVSNTAVGFKALFKDATGSFNVGVGDSALSNIVKGDNNIGIGVDAGAKLKNGDDNIYIDNPGKSKESKTIRMGSPKVHKHTFFSGVMHGNGSKLTGVRVRGKNIRGKISGTRIKAGTLSSAKFAPDLTFPGTTSGTFSGTFNGNASSATTAITANTAITSITANTATTAVNATTADSATGVAGSNYRLAVTNTAAEGDDAAGFVFDSEAGLLLENDLTGGGNDPEGAGLFLGTNKAVIYSSGDNDVLQVIDEDNMSTLPVEPAFRVLNSNNGIQTPGRVNSETGVAPGGVEALSMLRGSINSSGALLEGSGFTSTRNAVGDYTITFNTAFADLPVITATATNIGSPETVTILSKTVNSCRVRVWNQAGAAVDSVFDFIVIGP